MSREVNLYRDPWVVVLDERAVAHEVSLADAFAEADRWRGLGGEMPTQSAVVLRLMLAILYRALRHDQADDEAAEEWAQWWQHGLPIDRIESYLAEHQDRFDLFSETAPFMQVAGLHTAKGTTSGLSKLIAEIPDGWPYFTTRAGRGLESIGAAEAARWVVHAHAFDPSGIKSGADGDPRVKGGKGYPIGTGWCGNVGLVIPEGRSLAETLLLNLVHDRPSPAGDTAPWERDPATPAEEAGLASRPAGPVSLLTWQSRRLRLIREDSGRVVDALVCNGDKIGGQNRQREEYQTAWRRSPNQEKAGTHGAVVYMPVRHAPERAVWRGLGGLLAGAATGRGTVQDAQRLLPPVVDWLGRLARLGVLDRNHPIRFRTVGAEYGSQSSTITAITDDAMSLRAAVLTDDVLKDTVVEAVDATDKAVWAFRSFAANLAQAAGGEPDGPRERATERAWNVLDRPFRDWARGLNAETDVQQALTQWHTSAATQLRSLATELVREAGAKAFKGREVRFGSGEPTLVDAALADAWFRAALAKALDRAVRPSHPQEPTPPEVRTSDAPTDPSDRQ
ncbi:MAG: type I-E CRISPR-associated protein Cse1/CasA [Dermatophilus congolensis]|nr:type I-E CRISPR-associated protein Cse1/CasA [Dermatophilus congolensis]